MEVRIEKLDRPEHHGDWHDKPLRYAVMGPGVECQKFSTKKEAKTYATDRRRSSTQAEAFQKWQSRGSGPLDFGSRSMMKR